MKRKLLLSLLAVLLASAPAWAAADPAARINGHLEAFSRALARALESPEIRLLIHEQAAKRFDGDAELLYRSIADHPLAIGGTLQAALRKLAVGQGFADAATFDRFTAQNARLQIAVPFLLDRWEAETYVPRVTFWPVGLGEADIAALRAFDAAGRLEWLDAQGAQSLPTVVVSFNERTDRYGYLRPPFERVKMEVLCDPEAFICEPDGGGGGGGGGGGVGGGGGAAGCTVGAAHAAGDTESLYTLTIYDDHEPWYKGDPEIMVRWTNPVSGLQATIDLPDVNSENQEYTLDRSLFGWTSPSAAGFLFEIWEDDIGIAGVIDGDDFVGSAYVAFSDANCRDYQAGDAAFKMKFK